MKRRDRILWGALGILSALALVGIASVLAEGGLFSRSHHAWSVTIHPAGEGPWSVEVPRLVNTTSPFSGGNESLARLLATLRVESGRATFTLRPDALAISGEGDATVGASWRGPRGAEGFADWRASGANATSLSGPAVEIGWRVDLSGGRGHTCWAKAEHSVRLEPGTSQQLPVSSAPTEPQVRLWQTECA